MNTNATTTTIDTAPTAKGNSAASRDIASYLHPYTNLATHEKTGPHIISKGHGIYVTDDNGRDFIEGMAGLWCASLGFDENRLVKAATKQLETLPYYHTFAMRSHTPAIELAEKLIGMAPKLENPMSKVFFTNSGSEANDTVVKMIWYRANAMGQPQRKKIISRIKGYHGITIASGSMTGLPANHGSFDLPLPGFAPPPDTRPLCVHLTDTDFSLTLRPPPFSTFCL